MEHSRSQIQVLLIPAQVLLWQRRRFNQLEDSISRIWTNESAPLCLTIKVHSDCITSEDLQLPAQSLNYVKNEQIFLLVCFTVVESLEQRRLLIIFYSIIFPTEDDAQILSSVCCWPDWSRLSCKNCQTLNWPIWYHYIPCCDIVTSRQYSSLICSNYLINRSRPEYFIILGAELV